MDEQEYTRPAVESGGRDLVAEWRHLSGVGYQWVLRGTQQEKKSSSYPPRGPRR